MSSGIVVTIFLPGTLSGPVKHTTKQVGTVDVSPIGSKKPEYMTRKIKHTDRTPTVCARVFPVAGEIVKLWINGEAPYGIKPQVWSKMNREQRISTYLSRMDEGYGFKFE